MNEQDEIEYNVKIHPVVFEGHYATEGDIPRPRSPYGSHRDDGKPVSNMSVQKLIDIVKAFPDKKITIIDYGGGNGKAYATLKRATDKEFDYNIIELPGVGKDLGDEVKYFTSLEDAPKSPHIFYSDATINLTEDSVEENIKNFCNTDATCILLTRSILAIQGEDQSFYTYAKHPGPKDARYFNICNYFVFNQSFIARGYELTHLTWSNTGKAPGSVPPPLVFKVRDRDPSNPIITYYDHVFFKKVDQ